MEASVANAIAAVVRTLNDRAKFHKELGEKFIAAPDKASKQVALCEQTIAMTLAETAHAIATEFKLSLEIEACFLNRIGDKGNGK